MCIRDRYWYCCRNKTLRSSYDEASSAVKMNRLDFVCSDTVEHSINTSSTFLKFVAQKVDFDLIFQIEFTNFIPTSYILSNFYFVTKKSRKVDFFIFMSNIKNSSYSMFHRTLFKWLIAGFFFFLNI